MRHMPYSKMSQGPAISEDDFNFSVAIFFVYICMHGSNAQQFFSIVGIGTLKRWIC
jgi:hypothetical protein